MSFYVEIMMEMGDWLIYITFKGEKQSNSRR